MRTCSAVVCCFSLIDATFFKMKQIRVNKIFSILCLALFVAAVAGRQYDMTNVITDLKRAQALQDTGEHKSAAAIFDALLEKVLSPSSAQYARVPPNIHVGMLISSGRSHFASSNMKTAYDRFLEAKRTAPHSHPDMASGTVDQILCRISSDLAMPIANQHYEDWLHVSPESIEAHYDYAMWLTNQSTDEKSRFRNGTLALKFLYAARDLLVEKSIPATRLHKGIKRPFYIWALVLHEIGRLERSVNEDEDSAKAAFNIGVEIGLWQNPSRRYLGPLAHPEWPSKPVVQIDDGPLYPMETVQFLRQNVDIITTEVLRLRQMEDTNSKVTPNEEHAPMNGGRHGGVLWSVEGESLHDVGVWRMIRFTQDGEWNDHTCSTLLPQTCSLLRKIPDLIQCIANGCSELFVYLSRLSPGTNILPHCGPTWKRRRIHLVVEPGAASGGGAILRVGEHELQWENKGDIFVFDDSFEHEVKWSLGPDGMDGLLDQRHDRIVLIVDVFHPGYKAWAGLFAERNPTTSEPGVNSQKEEV